MPNWSLFLTILLAVVLAQVLAKKFLGSSSESSSATIVSNSPVALNTTADYVKLHFPNAVTV